MTPVPAAASAPRILVVEDDAELREMLIRLLGDEGYDVTTAADGQSGLQLALNRTFDVVLLDRGLPFVDGLELLTRLRKTGWAVPVLVLSAYGTAPDRVRGLDAGAEDYLVKPFDFDELLARLRALRRRHHDTAELLPIVGGLLDEKGRQVLQKGGGQPVSLSTRETELLCVLARRPRQVFTREDLRARVFPEAEADTVVDTYVHYLRTKLGRRVVSTVHGVGYRVGSEPGSTARDAAE